MLPPVAQLSVAYGAGVWTGLLFSTWMPVAMGCALLVIRSRRRPGTGVVLLCAVTLGGLVGAHTRAARGRECRAAWQPGPQAATVLVHDAPGARRVTDATVLVAAAGCGGTLRLRLGDSSLSGGSTVVVIGTYHSAGVLRVGHLRVLPQRRAWRFAVRDRIARRIRRLYGRRSGIIEALVLGRRHDIDPKLRQTFAAAGLAHLLAISGLHVGLIAGWLHLLLRLLGARRSTWLWTAAATWAYVFLLGFPAPATRAAGFLTILGVGRARGRHPQFAAVLAVAGFVILLLDPSAATSVGAWLSMAAVWGTHEAGRALSPRLRRQPLLRLTAATAGATLLTAPITAYAFGSVAPVGMLANLVAVPLAGVAVPGVFASLVLGGTVAAGAGVALAAIEHTAVWAAALPGGHLTGSAGWRFALPWIVILAAALWYRRARPPWRLVRRRLLAVAALGGWMLAGLSARQRGDHPGELVIHVLNVGQGDAIAIQTPRGRWMLVDAGPRVRGWDAGRRVVVPFLRGRGVRSLAALVVSHGDADHLGGVPAVVRALDPALVIEPGQPIATSLYREHLAAIDAAGIAWQVARAGDTLSLDSVVMSVLHPSRPWIARQLVPNENSVVLKLSYGCFDIVLAGDAGAPAESALVTTARAALDEVDVLKVGHHGSRGSTTERWLDVLRPRLAVISVGPNRYGHPAPEVIRRLERHGIPVLRTDHGGTVTIRTDGRYLVMERPATSTLPERIRCLVPWLRSSGSSWSRSGCTRPPPVSLPICSTTSLSPPRSSRATSGARVSWISSGPSAVPTSRVNSSRSSTSSPTRP